MATPLRALVCLAWILLITPSAAAEPVRDDDRRTIVVEVGRGGFDWGDAAIGGAVVIGLLFVGAGARMALNARPDNQGGSE